MLGRWQNCWKHSKVRQISRFALVSENGLEEIQEKDLQDLVQELENGQLAGNSEIYRTLFRRCAASRSLEAARRVQAHIVRNLQDPDVFVRNGMVETFAKCGDLEQAKQVFDRMDGRNSYSWNIMVAAYAQNGDPRDTVRSFQEMDMEGFKPYKHSYSNMLTACASLGNISQGRDVHPDIVAGGLENNVIIATALVNLYGKCGSVGDSRRTFEKIVAKDVICWSSMIAVLAVRGSFKDSMELYRRMLFDGFVPEEITFVSLVSACTAAGAVKEAEELHACAASNGFEVDAVFGGSLVNLYGKCGRVEAAEEVHEKMQCRNVVSWTALISAYAQEGHPLKALHSLKRMDQEGVKLNDVTFVNLLGACYAPEFLEAGRSIHARLMITGHRPDDILGTAVVNMYGKCGSLGDAKRSFDSLESRDTVAWNAMLAVFVQLGCFREACDLCLRMQLEGSKADDGTFVSLLDACGEMEDLTLGKKFHGWISGSSYEQDEGIASALMNMYGKCGGLEDAKRLFNVCRRKPLLAWNALAAAYAQNGNSMEAMNVCMRVDLEGFKFDEATFVSAFCACSFMGCLDQGRKLHQRLLASGLRCNVTVWNSLINMYGKCGSVGEARLVFDGLSKRDIITWNAMFAAYAQEGDSLESLRLLRLMDFQGVKADEITIVSVLTACGCSASLGDSKKLHERAIACGMDGGDAVGGLLVNAYGKCGSLENARRLFGRMRNKKLFTWTALLASYAQHGHGKEALEVYQSMDLEGLKPSEVTYITILFACSHAGLLHEGRYYFLSMTGDHGLEALEDHYKCMMDLFARVGMLSEVEELIDVMPYKSDYLSWMTLLGACKVHSDFKRADRAAENALRLDPGNSTACIMISNMYSGSSE